MRWLAATLLGLGLALDIMSFVIAIRRNTGRTRASGIPLVPLIFYYINTEWLKQLFVLSTPGREMILWTAVHVGFQYLLPIIHRWFFTKSQATSQ